MNVDTTALDLKPSPAPARTLTLLPLLVAFVGALIEVLVVDARRRREPLMTLSGDFVWMAPLALMGVVLGIVAVTHVLGRVWEETALSSPLGCLRRPRSSAWIS